MSSKHMSSRRGKKAQEPGKNSKNRAKKHKAYFLAVDTQNKFFHAHFLNQYGSERWASLSQSLQKRTQHVALLNKYANKEFAFDLLGVNDLKSAPYLPDLFRGQVYAHSEGESKEEVVQAKPTPEEVDEESDEEDAKEPPQPVVQAAQVAKDEEHDDDFSSMLWPSPGANLDPSHLAAYYPLDAASLFPVMLLDVQSNHQVLDLCAAPGGKSLFILQHLTTGHLTCSDVSYDRKRRLERMIRQYLPGSMHEQVDVIHGDATSKRFLDEFSENKKFHRILVDAPCASERHLIMKSPFFLPSHRYSSPKEAGGVGGGEPSAKPTGVSLADISVSTPLDLSILPACRMGAVSSDDFMSWAPGRSRSNAERQVSLLKTAFQLCRVDGRIVYSTCSINAVENDQVIEKILKKINKKKDGAVVEVVRINKDLMPYGEPTEYGWHILPDVSGGWGPIYMCVLTKRKVEIAAVVGEVDSDEDDV